MCWAGGKCVGLVGERYRLDVIFVRKSSPTGGVSGGLARKGNKYTQSLLGVNAIFEFPLGEGGFSVGRY